MFATNVYAEMTPNPATMKFVADRMIIPGHGVAEYLNAADVNGSSPLAEALFNFPFVKSVFVAANFVTVTKTDTISWDFITMELREFVSDFLRKNEWAVTRLPEAQPRAEGEAAPALPGGGHAEPQSETDEKIISLLDEYVRPAVESDGGAIHFKSFHEGQVTLVLKGACSGCPSSTATLKNGIETMLREMLPEVNEVVAEAQ